MPVAHHAPAVTYNNYGNQGQGKIYLIHNKLLLIIISFKTYFVGYKLTEYMKYLNPTLACDYIIILSNSSFQIGV